MMTTAMSEVMETTTRDPTSEDERDDDIVGHFLVKPKPTPLRCPCRVLVCGRTGCGKSGFVEKMCEEMNDWFNVHFHTVYYVYPNSKISGGIRETHIKRLRASCEKAHVLFRSSCEKVNTFLDSLEEGPPVHRLVILDDLATSIVNDQTSCDAFTRISHHYNISFFFITQNFFTPGKYAPTIVRNFTDFVIFLSQLNQVMQREISKRLFNGNSKFLDECLSYLLKEYANCYDRYVLIDHNDTSHPNIPAHHLGTFGVRTHLFKNKKGKRRIEYLRPHRQMQR